VTPEQKCPLCGSRVTDERAAAYWAVAVGRRAQGAPAKVEADCCHAQLSYEEVKALRWGDREQASAWGRKLSGARTTYGAGTGRPPGSYSHRPRCPCGRQTLKRAQMRGKSATDHAPGCAFYMGGRLDNQPKQLPPPSKQ
jgi:hypothetical protein